jgi:flagellar basal-body rod protein FlgF
MIKGIYSSGAGMQPRMMRLEVIGNNLANINTTGFKRDNLFIEILKNKGVDMAQGKGDLAGLKANEFTDFSAGSLTQTNNQLDLAIVGDGFFTIDTPGGTRYTRNGNFMLTVDGSIVTNQGYPVLGTGGKIQLPDVNKLAQGDIGINEAGEIMVGNKPVAKLRVVTFENLTTLKKDKSTCFSTDAPAIPVDPSKNTVSVRQGFLEESNVDGIEEMMVMIELGHSFESDQKAVQSQDETLQRAMDVGRL